MRLDKFIGNNSGLSRTQITAAIKQGLVSVNGIAIKKNNIQLLATDDVELNGKKIEARQPVYLMLHKPIGYVCANTDSEHPTVLDLINLPFKYDLQIAGRLDLDTTGLVLLTDNGQWNHKITSPKNSHTKSYRVTTADPIDTSLVTIFSEGILLKNETKSTLPAQLTIIDKHTAQLIICEGKYHQVKRMFAATGNRVTQLHRERIGSIVLPDDLSSGQYRALTPAEINSFENSL